MDGWHVGAIASFKPHTLSWQTLCISDGMRVPVMDGFPCYIAYYSWDKNHTNHEAKSPTETNNQNGMYECTYEWYVYIKCICTVWVCTVHMVLTYIPYICMTYVWISYHLIYWTKIASPFLYWYYCTVQYLLYDAFVKRKRFDWVVGWRSACKHASMHATQIEWPTPATVFHTGGCTLEQLAPTLARLSVCCTSKDNAEYWNGIAQSGGGKFLQHMD